MRFRRYSDKELSELNLIPDGEYQAEIFEAVDKKDKNQDPMIALKVKVYDAEGRARLVNDWLLVSVPIKLKHFFYSTGMQAKYDDENYLFTGRDCIGKSCIVRVVTKPDADGKKWSRIDDYLMNSQVSNSDLPFKDDDLPLNFG